MKKILLLIALLSGFSLAQTNNKGLGLWFGSCGSCWGLDFKMLSNNKVLNSDNTVLDIYLGDFRFGDETAIGLSAGYYFSYNVIKADASSIGRFPLYWGPNAGFGYWSGGKEPNRYRGIDIGASLVGGISWFTPTTPQMDVSLELITPGIGMWRQSNEQGQKDKWEASYNPAFGLKGDLGFRLLFHIFFF